MFSSFCLQNMWFGSLQTECSLFPCSELFWHVFVLKWPARPVLASSMFPCIMVQHRVSFTRYLAQMHQSSLQINCRTMETVKRFGLKFHCCFSNFSINVAKSCRNEYTFYLLYSSPPFPYRFFFFHLAFQVFKSLFHLTIHSEVRTMLNILNKERLPWFRFMSSSCTWYHLYPFLSC